MKIENLIGKIMYYLRINSQFLYNFKGAGSLRLGQMHVEIMYIFYRYKVGFPVIFVISLKKMAVLKFQRSDFVDTFMRLKM